MSERLQVPSVCVHVSEVSKDKLFQPVRGRYKPAHTCVWRLAFMCACGEQQTRGWSCLPSPLHARVQQAAGGFAHMFL